MTTQELIDTPEKYAEAKRYLNERDDDVVMDTETNGLDFVNNRMVGTGLLAGERAFYLPFRHAQGRNLPEAFIGDMCETILRPDRVQVGYHYGFDVKIMRKEGMQMPDRFEDPMLRAHVLNENEDSWYKMEDIATKYLSDSAGDSEDRLIAMLVDRFGGSKKGAKSNLWRLSGEDVLDYGTQDLITTRDLRDWQRPHLDSWSLEGIAKEVEDFQRTIAEIELAGCYIDRELLATAGDHAQERERQVEADIQKLAGYKLNPRSPKQLKAWLGLPNTKGDLLRTLVDEDPRAGQLLDYRAWQKVAGTYYRPIANGVDLHGYVHPDFRVTGTVSGRLSCGGIALQGIPRAVDDEASPYFGVKRLFAAPEGQVFIEFDYAQAEIVVMAHYSRDPTLLDILSQGLSMHDVVAERQGVPRPIAKALNFSAQYGIGAPKFAENYGFKLAEAQKYLRGYRELFSNVVQFSRQCERIARKRGHIRTWSGRVRHFNTPKAKIHAAANNVIQGAVACALRRAMPRIQREVPDFQMCHTCHDSVCGYAKPEDVPHVVPAVREIMEGQFRDWCSTEMRVDAKVGADWATGKELN